jgi:hypothetical protein
LIELGHPEFELEYKVENWIYFKLDVDFKCIIISVKLRGVYSHMTILIFETTKTDVVIVEY